MSSPAFGQVIKEPTLLGAFLESPGEFLVARTFQQMAQVPGFVMLFGPFKPLVDPVSKNPVGVVDQGRWADYDRRDWSIQQLPVVNLFEADVESKSSSQAYLEGTVNLQVYWPPSQRRSDLARVQAAFKGIVENFFESKLCTEMLDELYWIERPAKVPGLNHYGRMLTWSPNVEGMIEPGMVPVSLLPIKYRIDLRAWYRYLEFKNRTKEQPFTTPLTDLQTISSDIQGTDGIVNNAPDVKLEYEVEFTVNGS